MVASLSFMLLARIYHDCLYAPGGRQRSPGSRADTLSHSPQLSVSYAQEISFPLFCSPDEQSESESVT
jgi:hypothetical protein